MTRPPSSTRSGLGPGVGVGAKVDRDLVFARVEQRLLGGAFTPVQVGRFVVLNRIGHGGMGVVYAAHDPQLDRAVALKIVDDGGGEGSTPQAQQELLREAKAAAALTHPNVVTIFEAGLEGEVVYLAMELVRGPTLRDWLQERRRTWREIVAMFAAAGRGLEAAHQAGLVHRDFKPANVLVGDDGRPRVADFGLARLAPRPATEPRHGDTPASGEGTFTSVAGTPRYMAPEQHEGRGIGPASDQFSFCVALYEALFDRHPYEGDHPAAIVRRTMAGLPDPPGARARGVPRQVVQLVMRGVAGLPSERNASMRAVIDGLDHALHRRRRWVLGGLAFGLTGVAATAGYGAAPREVLPLDPCAKAAAPLYARWSPALSRKVDAAFVESGHPGADRIAARVTETLDDYAEQWSTLRVQTCRAAREHGGRSELAMELGYACLDRRLTAMSTLIERFVAADEKIVARAVAAVDALVPLRSCEDRSALLARPSTNALRSATDRSARPEADEQWHQGFERYRRAVALDSLGRRDEALAIAESMLDHASDQRLGGVEAAALGLRGGIAVRRGNLDAGEADLGRSVTLALEADLPDVAVQSLLRLSQAVRKRQSGLERAGVLLDMARGLAARSPAPVRDALRVEVEAARVDRMHGDFARARQRLDEALAQAHDLGPEHSVVLGAHNDRASNLVSLGEYEQAEHVFAALLPRTVAAKGSQHKTVGTLLINLGVVAQAQHHWAQADAYFSRALVLFEQRGDRRRLEQIRFRQGVMRREQGRLQDAATSLIRVLADRSARKGPDHASVAEVLEALAEVRRQQGDHDVALAHARQAVALLEKSHGADHLSLRAPLVTLGKTHIDREQWAQAESVLERAHALVYATEVDGIVRAEVCFDLARATVADPAKRARAVELGRRARALFAEAGPPMATVLAEVDAWLRQHAP